MSLLGHFKGGEQKVVDRFLLRLVEKSSTRLAMFWIIWNKDASVLHQNTRNIITKTALNLIDLYALS